MGRKGFNFLILISLFLPTLLFSQVDTAWVRRYNGPGNGVDVAYAMALDNYGNLYVTGKSLGSGTGYDFCTIKYDQNGNLVWVKRYNGPANGDDWANGIVLDNQGNIYVTGRSYDSITLFDFCTIKYDSNGKEVWVRRYNGARNYHDASFAIAVDDFNNVYVAGYASESDSLGDYCTIKYDENGNEIWVRRYNGPGNGTDRANAIKIDILGNVYVTGYSFGSGTDYDYCTIKYDEDGNELWVRRYDDSTNNKDMAFAIAVDNQNNIYVTGGSFRLFRGYDYCTIKYDGDGNELWVRRYNRVSYDDIPTALAVDNYGNVYVTGYSWLDIFFTDYTTIKYDQNGNELWINGVYRYGISVAEAIVVDGYGNVYVTGSVSGGLSSPSDYCTVKYNQFGNRLWAKGYNGPGNSSDVAYAILVDNQNNIYVTGYSLGSGTDADYCTIKYTQETGIGEEKIKENFFKPFKESKIYDLTGKLVKEKKLQKGIYFKITEKGREKILILK